MTTILESASMENDLRLPGMEPFVQPEWLSESYRDADSFWKALKKTGDARFAVKSVSSLFTRYNFYHDIITRNLNNPSPAIYWQDGAAGFRSLSYRELGALSAAKAAGWQQGGLKAGQHLCIIRPAGLDLLVELVAALKLGCTMSFLPPQGRGFIQRRLTALEPDHIATDKTYGPFLSEWRKIVLADRAGGEGKLLERDQFYYDAGSVVFRSFNPCAADPLAPVDIMSDAAYLSALRDGTVALGLGPGQVYAAPGLPLMETYPALLVAGLLCGATYLHLSPKAIAENPELAIQFPVKVFGVTKQVRDILLEKRIEIGRRWECWFRNPAESPDMERWYFFIKSLKLDDAYAFNLLWQAALSGCSLFSVRRKGMAHMQVMPAAGSSWQIEGIAGGGARSVSDAGTLSLSVPGMPAKEKIATADMIAKNDGEWIYAGMNAVHRQGRTYPVREVLESLRPVEMRFKFFSSLVDVPLVDAGGRRIVLLVFRGAKAAIEDGRILSEINSVIAGEMGEAFQLDKVEFFPLYPRFLADSSVDHEWCRNQYLNGGLFRRGKMELFHRSTRLRACIMSIKNAQGIA